MKYLDYPELELLSRALTFETAECRVFTRIEAYSCKAGGKERKLMKSIEDAYGGSSAGSGASSSGIEAGRSSGSSKGQRRRSSGEYSGGGADEDEDGMAYSSSSASSSHHQLSSSFEPPLDSPFGRLDQPSARRVLFLLITTLNDAFPDHDFSLVHPLDFRREESSGLVLHSLSSTLLSLRGGSGTPRSFSSLPNGYESSSAASGTSSGGGGQASGSWRNDRQGGDSKSLGRSPRLLPLDAQQQQQQQQGRSSAAGAIARSAAPPSFASHPALAAVLDDIMSVAECDVYTFHPSLESDPHASGEPDEDEDDLLGRPADLAADEEEYWSGEEEGGADGPLGSGSGGGGGGTGGGRMVNVFNERAADADSPSASGGGFSTRDTTPRPGHAEDDLTDEENRNSDYDDPLFDEDYQGGFRPGDGDEREGAPTTAPTSHNGSHGSRRSSRGASKTGGFAQHLAAPPDSPQTPVSIRREYFPFAGKGKSEDKYHPPPSSLRDTLAASGRRPSSSGLAEDEEEVTGEYDDAMDEDEKPLARGSGSGRNQGRLFDRYEAEQEEELADDEDDEETYDSGVGSVLWTTYAFFYNKRLKRVLFVNVWARRNVGAYTDSTSPSGRMHPISQHQTQPTRSSGQSRPVQTKGGSAQAMRNRKQRLGTPLATAAKAVAAADPGSNVATPSPAKRAIQKAMGGAGSGESSGTEGGSRRGRTSNSPGPSAMSPFPHDAETSKDAVAVNTAKRGRKSAA